MKPRTLTWDDIPRVHELLARRWAVDDPRAQMHIGDLYWVLRGTADGDRLSDTRVMAAGGRLAGRVRRGWIRRTSATPSLIRREPQCYWTKRWTGSRTEYREPRQQLDHRRSSWTAMRARARSARSARIRARRRRKHAPLAAAGIRTDRADTAVRVLAGSRLDGGRHRAARVRRIRLVRVTTTAHRRHVAISCSACRSTSPSSISSPPRLTGPAHRRAPSGTTQATKCGEFEAVGTSKAYRRRGAWTQP